MILYHLFPVPLLSIACVAELTFTPSLCSIGQSRLPFYFQVSFANADLFDNQPSGEKGNGPKTEIQVDATNSAHDSDTG